MDQPSPTLDTEHSLTLRRALAADLSPDMIELVMAGVRARGVADACERLGLAAVLIDGSGRVLHVASAAQAWLGKDVDLVAGHLIGRTRADNAALEEAIGAALSPASASLDRPDGCDRQVCGLPWSDGSPFQLLRGILIFKASATALDESALRSLLGVEARLAPART